MAASRSFACALSLLAGMNPYSSKKPAQGTYEMVRQPIGPGFGEGNDTCVTLWGCWLIVPLLPRGIVHDQVRFSNRGQAPRRREIRDPAADQESRQADRPEKPAETSSQVRPQDCPEII